MIDVLTEISYRIWRIGEWLTQKTYLSLKVIKERTSYRIVSYKITKITSIVLTLKKVEKKNK